MANAALLGPDLALGDEILEMLDAAKFPVTAALWAFSEDHLGGWQFVIGTPLYEKLGTSAAYGRLITAVRMADPQSMRFEDVRLMGNREPFVRELRRTFKGVQFRKGERIGSKSLGGIYIEEGLLYRIK
jgi:hypothetical protein